MTKYFITVINQQKTYKIGMNDINKVNKLKKRRLPKVPEY